MSSLDTAADVTERQRDRLRRMTPAERFAEGARLCASARRVMRDGIRHRHPDYTDEQVEMAFARLVWGDDLYRAARPDWPLLAP
jgi:hypothetical protein